MCSASQPSSRAMHRGDAQRQALLAEQRVAAVARAVRPDLAGVGEVARCTCVLMSGSHGHGTSFWPGASGAPTECTHGMKKPSPSTSSTCWPMRVMIRMLVTTYGLSVICDADLGDRRAERTHAERNDVQRAAAHAAVELARACTFIFVRRHPVVGRPGLFLVSSSRCRCGPRRGRRRTGASARGRSSAASPGSA